MAAARSRRLKRSDPFGAAFPGAGGRRAAVFMAL